MEQNPLWEYSISVYGKPRVESLLMQLQDNFGVDVNILLSCAWLASRGKDLNDDTLSLLLSISAICQGECIIPLRSLRRRMKKLEGAETIYVGVKALELEAERWQQDLLCEGLKNLTLVSSHLGQVDLALQHCQLYSNHLANVEWGDMSALVGDLMMSIAR